MTGTVAVLGAGVVGVSCALELQRRGARVTLIDRRPPGRETSYGNAGVIARSSLIPLNNPGLWRSLPKLLSNSTASLRYDISFVLRNLGWTLAFLASARRGPFEETVTALDALIRCSMEEHRRLISEAGAEDRLRDTGWLLLYRTEAAYASTALARETYQKFGVATERLDAGALSDLEPSLNPIFARGIWVRDACSVDSPGCLVEDYARLFAGRGGVIEQREIRSLVSTEGRWTVADANGGSQAFDTVVVALGPWSGGLLGNCGIRVPMGFERGYHMHYAALESARLNRPVYDAAGGYVMSPMAKGLRLTTGVEVNACDAPANPVQLSQALDAARQAFPLGDALEDEPWMGRRPTLPDSRPIIGQAPGRRGLWLAFGHQHIGFGAGPGTARVLADLMTDQKPPIDARPFRPERFLA